MKKYITPDFDVSTYEIEETITTSTIIIGGQDPEGGDGSGWWG